MIHLSAPAKLNLYLRVLGRRSDGYHDIETLFERIDLADELTFKIRPSEMRLACSCLPIQDAQEQPMTQEANLSCGENNLVLRAARLLQTKCGVSHGAFVHLLKRIPISAGLGGGSSDAAATLLGLNQLWELGLSRARLLELGAELGSDVPFFLSGASFALGRGRGELCEGLDVGRSLTHILVVDGQLSTKDIYEGSQFDLTATKPSISILAHALRNGSLDELAQGLWNDLEPEANRRCPRLNVIKSRLREFGCYGVLLSGSGPAVFGLCRDLDHARQVASRIKNLEARTSRVEIIQTLHRQGALR